MRLKHFHAYQPICPNCQSQYSQAHKLELQIRSMHPNMSDWVEEGQLFCRGCRSLYPILKGIPIIVPDPSNYLKNSVLHALWPEDESFFFQQWVGECSGPNSAFELSRNYLSTYGWSHYNDVNPSSTSADTSSGLCEIAKAINLKSSGLTLDLGCSVGRLSFEWAKNTSDLTSSHSEPLCLGIDLNYSMVQFAQRILKTSTVQYGERAVGTTYRWVDFKYEFPNTEHLDFWVADVLSLPFSSESIDQQSSLNLLDCVADPIRHLQELNRVQKRGHGKYTIVTPYDWSGQATEYSKWIGGQAQMSAFGGSSQRELSWLMSKSSPYPDLCDAQIVRTVEKIPWRIRIHDRSTMHYQVHLVELIRQAI
ncbi:MAG: hypothetical protein CMK59_12405 [Proteobacteria bacterium]|nr:hypothetical protein [Pseudomonadota bacterium]